MKGASKAAIVLMVIGIIYAIAPDPIPGPVDDLIINLILDCIAFLLYKKGNENDYHIGDGIGEETVKSSAAKAATYAATSAVEKTLGGSSAEFQSAAKNLAAVAATDAVRKGFEKFSTRQACNEEDNSESETVTTEECNQDTVKDSSVSKIKSF